MTKRRFLPALWILFLAGCPDAPAAPHSPTAPRPLAPASGLPSSTTVPSAIGSSDSSPAASPANSTSAKTGSLFDPARHMRVSEVKPGMTGYGLSVFHDDIIERFDVEVISVLRNFNAGNDVVLIRCKGDYLQHTGSVAGMSGSPIFLRDDSGHDRMIGAFAYGWPMTKDPVAGVQPIEYMLDLSTTGPADVYNARGEQPTHASTPVPASPPAGGRAARWSLADAGLLPVAWKTPPRSVPGASVSGLVNALSSDPGFTAAGDWRADSSPRMQPLATPVMVSGVSSLGFSAVKSRFKGTGLTPLEAGVGGGQAGAAGPSPRLEPGSVLAVPLLSGDMEMTAIGTTTEVIGNRVWGFGHPFNNEGPVSLPMGPGVINGVIANLQTSFKLGSITQASGTLSTDGSVGIAGQVGHTPTIIPIEVTVQSASGKVKTYHFEASRHPKFTPMVAASAFSAAASGVSELPQYNTVDYDVRIVFADGQSIRLVNRAVNATSGDLFGDAAIVLQAASENPFQRLLAKQITATMTVRDTAMEAQILDVNLPRGHYHAGEKLKTFVTCQPFRGEPTIIPVDLDIPHDVAPGEYQLVISDAKRYFADEQASKPFEFFAESLDDVLNVLRDVAALRENAIYVRLLQHPDGIAIGHTALQRLPSSRRQILLDSGRSNTTAFVSSSVAIVPTELVMNGSAEFTIEIESKSKVTTGAPKPGKIDLSPNVLPAQSKPDKAPAIESP